MPSRLASQFSILIKQHFRGQGRITQELIELALRDIRRNLLEADVALPAVKQLVAQVRERAQSTDINKNIQPGQLVIKIVQEELTKLIEHESKANFSITGQLPVVIMLVGLQGAGKTTTAAKLAVNIKKSQHKHCLLASVDVHRPAAVEQLAQLAQQNDIDFFEANNTSDPVIIAQQAYQHAKKHKHEGLIVDTAGRMEVQTDLMQEMVALTKALSPKHLLFVIDSTMGQDAFKTATAFNEAVPITGLILTKTDSDARGGAALSAKSVTGKPILFTAHGETSNDLSPFSVQQLVNQLLGQEDALDVIKQIQAIESDAQIPNEAAVRKTLKQGLSLSDFLAQLEGMHSMGGLGKLVEKIPRALPQVDNTVLNEKEQEMHKWKAIIQSMTAKERNAPAVLNGSRKRRIARGSGTHIQDLNRMLKQFKMAQKMMSQFSSKKRFLKNILGQMSKAKFPSRF